MQDDFPNLQCERRLEIKWDLFQNKCALRIVLWALALRYIGTPFFTYSNIVFKRTALANNLVHVAELLLTVGKLSLMNQCKLESMYFQIKLHAISLKKSLLKSVL